MEDYTRAIQLDLFFSKPFKRRGGCFERRGDSKSSFENTEKALEINPYDFKAFHDKGLALYELER